MIPGIVSAARVVPAVIETSFPLLSAYLLSAPVSGTSHSVTVSNTVGVRNIVFLTTSLASGVSVSFPAGWTEIASTTTAAHRGVIAYRDAVGGDPVNISVGTAVSCGIQATCAVITAGTFSSTAPVATATLNGAGTVNPDPPSASNPSGVKKHLIFAWAGCDNLPSLTGYPLANNQQAHNRGSTPNCGSGICSISAEVSSYDPGAFTLSASQPWIAATVLVAGA